MGKLEIFDDCLVPEREIFLTYSGPDPWGVVKKISDTIKPFFHISTSSTSNDRLNWDISGDPITFYSTWWAKKSMSGKTSAMIHIVAQGSVSKTDNTGQFTLRLYGDLNTKFGGPSIILKPAWLMYSYFFYNRVRRGYIEMCRNFIINFRNEIKEHYNLSSTTVPGKETAFG